MAKKPAVQLYYKLQFGGTIRKLTAEKHPNIIRFISDRTEKILQMHMDYKDDKNPANMPKLYIKSYDWDKVLTVLGLTTKPVNVIHVFAEASTFYVSLVKSIEVGTKDGDISQVPKEDTETQK